MPLRRHGHPPPHAAARARPASQFALLGEVDGCLIPTRGWWNIIPEFPGGCLLDALSQLSVAGGLALLALHAHALAAFERPEPGARGSLARRLWPELLPLLCLMLQASVRRLVLLPCIP